MFKMEMLWSVVRERVPTWGSWSVESSFLGAWSDKISNRNNGVSKEFLTGERGL
jgi:hypothetical protein